MSYKLFYTDYTLDTHVKSDEAKSATIEQIIDCMKEVLNEEDNFVGIINSDNEILQFMQEDNGTVCVDVPIQDRKGSFTKNADLEECIALVNSLKAELAFEKINGLEFKTWG